MAVRTLLPDVVPERSTLRYTGVLKDELDAVVPGGALTTLTLTLYALDNALTIINGVDGTNILNLDRGTIDANGNLAILFTPLDNQIVNAALPLEIHVFLLQWTYGAGGAKAGRHEVQFTVKNMAKVP